MHRSLLLDAFKKKTAGSGRFGHKGHHLPALLSHFSVELTGQLPVITGAHQEVAAKQKGRSEGLSSPVHATQIDSLHLVVMQLGLSSS